MIPLIMVSGLSDERESYYHEAITSIATAWGTEQTLTGPFLVVPYAPTHKTTPPNWQVPEHKLRRQVVLIPDDNNSRITLNHEMRHRGIFEEPVYEANLITEGTFDLNRAIDADELDWSQTRLVFGVSGANGIRQAALQINNADKPLQPGTGLDWLGDGLHVKLDLSEQPLAPARKFALNLTARGIHSLAALLPGTSAQLSINSSWPHPSFRGRFLPDQAEVTGTGFQASWISHELARGFPTSWRTGDGDNLLWDKAVAVDLYEPVTPYRSVERGLKYGVLFIAVTFLTLLAFELTAKVRFHFVQYGITGLGLILFYLCLLSLAEHMVFLWAYVLSAFIIVALNSWYVWRMSDQRKLTLIFTAVTCAVYGVLYMLLRMEAYSLITGTAVLLVGLATLMRTTGRLNQASD